MGGETRTVTRLGRGSGEAGEWDPRTMWLSQGARAQASTGSDLPGGRAAGERLEAAEGQRGLSRGSGTLE